MRPMRLILNSALLLAAVTGLASPAHAQYSVRCQDIYLGGTRCTSSTGETYRYDPDPWGGGRATYSNPYGQSTNCRTEPSPLGYQVVCY